MTIRRWDLYRADLKPVVGHEQAGTGSVLVVSNDGFKRAAGVVTIVPLTRQAGKTRPVYPYEVLIPGRAAEIRPPASSCPTLSERFPRIGFSSGWGR